MADYTKRAAEVFALVLEFVRWSQADAAGAFSSLSRTLTPVELDRATADAGTERDHFLKKTTEYFETRKGRLDAIIATVKAICQDGYNRGGGDPQALFRAPIEVLREDNRRVLGSILTGLTTPSARAVDLKLRIQQEEDAFASGLAARGAPTCWSRIARAGRELTELRQNLVDGWAALVRKTNDIDCLANDAVQRMEDTLHRIYSGVSDRERALQGGLAEVATQLTGLSGDGSGRLERVRGGLDDVFARADRVLADYARNGAELRAGVVAVGRSCYDLRGLQEAERTGLHRVYQDTRTDLLSFLRVPPPDFARAKLQEGRELLGQWSGAMSQAGMRADAEALTQDLLSQLDEGLRAIDQDYAAFVSENKGRFYEKILPAHAAVLLCSDAWQQRWARVSGQVPLKLTFTMLPESCRAALEGPYTKLVAALKAWSVEGQEAARDALVTDLTARYTALQGRVRDCSVELQQTVDDANRFFQSSGFTGLFTREDLARSLTG